MPVAHHEYILYPEARKVPGYDTVSNALAHPDKYTPDCAYLHHHFQKEARRVLASSVVTMGSAYSVFRDGKNNFLGRRMRSAGVPSVTPVWSF